MFVLSLLRALPPEASPTDRCVLLALADMLGENEIAWPSIEVLAELAGCGVTAARRSVQHLESMALIRIHRRFRDRGIQTSNGYELLVLSCPPESGEQPSGFRTPTPRNPEGHPPDSGAPPSGIRGGISPSESLHLNRSGEEEGGSSAVALLLRGYQTRYEGRSGDMWQGHSAAMPHVTVVARWAERQAAAERAEVGAVVDRWLDSVFARPGLVKARWPWRKLSEDPARDYRPPPPPAPVSDMAEFRAAIDREVLETKLRNARTFGRADEATKLEQVLGRLEAVR